ncbi:MAG: radical SAM protein, partial [Alphaproteobacteria bacterium]|nr:radical SAM protein [Alphaproteobacteria bacterium]
FAEELVDCGVRRINVSLDTLDEENFTAITRWGKFAKVMAGIEAARAAGLRVKINTVALRGVNDAEIEDIVRWCGDKDMDLTFIETMPMGEIDGDRSAQYLPLSEVRARLAKSWTLDASDHQSGGPARYVTLGESGQRVGFITPLSHNFCESCNRVRLTCTGNLFMCLGQDDAADLRAPLRASADDATVIAAIREAISRKLKGHDFIIDRTREAPSISRHMSVTGG